MQHSLQKRNRSCEGACASMHIGQQLQNRWLVGRLAKHVLEMGLRGCVVCGPDVDLGENRMDDGWCMARLHIPMKEGSRALQLSGLRQSLGPNELGL